MPSVASISQQIWDMKYRLKGPDGVALDRTIEDSWRRIATALAEPEHDRGLWTERFYEAMEGFKFLPAGRVVAGAGSGRNVTLFNCFVMGAIPDDMAGIFTHLREAALTMQQGGGIGYDFSTLRPKGAPVKGVGADASAPIVRMTAEVAEEVYGKPALIVPLTGGTTPMFLFTQRGVPVLNPGVGWGSRNRAHSPNEFMRLGDFENAARHIARLLVRFASA